MLDFNANSEYEAGKYIELIPGFETSTGAVLDARIEGCKSCRPQGKQAKNDQPTGMASGTLLETQNIIKV
ncbi:UNVERIFIED_CONTAM: hypothetical protein IGO34_29315, partial [Salmonella enterica subsp. enterica serovar Weltevreden]